MADIIGSENAGERPGDTSTIESKVQYKRKTHLAEITAEMVVSSFTERKLHPGMNTMVPAVLIDEESVTRCLYDAEHDLLIVTGNMIWRDTNDQLLKAGVALLWTLINHRYFLKVYDPTTGTS